MSKLLKIAKDIESKHLVRLRKNAKDFSYPNAAPQSAQPEVIEAVERFRNLSEEERGERPLLYWLLGAGTPPYKADPVDVNYTDSSEGEEKCSNCRFAYKKVIEDDVFICSQIRGKIKPQGWCKWWKD